MKIVCVCGARPNFMKIAPLVDRLDRADGVEAILVHTGQHYDERLSQLFFGELGIREPNLNLEVGSGSHAAQTAQIMIKFEAVCLEHKPDWVVVVGDVNSTLAAALVATKLGIKVAHVESGLRSFDRTMPEEINRLMTDAVSDLLLVSEPSGVTNLENEGVASEKIHLVGNVMIDTLMRCRERAEQSDVLQRLSIEKNGYAVLTLHRPSNVDQAETLNPILRALEVIGRDMPIIFPIHPRSINSLEKMGMRQEVEKVAGLRLIEPLGYLDFMKLMADASLVLTDSGGIQEETTILNVPCLTLRANTERPITVSEGTNRLAGVTTEGILEAYKEVRANPPRVDCAPKWWDGKASQRIVERLLCTQPARV